MKLAVIFPGIGYHTDKPLLYYGKKLAAEQGYEIREVPYGNFPPNVKGSAEKMERAFRGALEQTEEILSGTDFSKYGEILFLSKSVGTAVASAYAGRHGLNTRNVYYTPVDASFRFMKQEGIVFHGTADGWADTGAVRRECERLKYPLYTIEGANHSLEVGEVGKDLENLKKIMEITGAYMASAEPRSL